MQTPTPRPPQKSPEPPAAAPPSPPGTATPAAPPPPPKRPPSDDEAAEAPAPLPAKRRRPCGLPAGVSLVNTCVSTVGLTVSPAHSSGGWEELAREFNISPAWRSILEDEMRQTYALHLLREYRQRCAVEEVLPGKEDVFAWTRFTSPERVRVVIVGQDPYHGPGQAHGLAFSVRKGVPVPPSLRNIYAAVQKTYPAFRLPAHGYLEKWALQGVLLINTTLTVRRGQPGSHASLGWHRLVRAVIDRLCALSHGLVFMLWGAHAQKFCAPNRQRHLVLTYGHPSPLSRAPFRDCPHFADANAYLAGLGKDPIDWLIE
ncbi:uracil-DNA glycosylase [Equid alphaherpesvirus 3]|uniref:Uracil-DNA glycosylase n=1 Tax=Equid alphaherpesvirus 3 TaxID=80341 RepID=A0A077BCN4_9ALPH|nr:uracil-DNA glycosylase [Equid alphaherpesvirus 3]AIL02978.1 uracil-DNA glycosylase [Equid alphaherpesvirus 3]